MVNVSIKTKGKKILPFVFYSHHLWINFTIAPSGCELNTTDSTYGDLKLYPEAHSKE